MRPVVVIIADVVIHEAFQMVFVDYDGSASRAVISSLTNPLHPTLSVPSRTVYLGDRACEGCVQAVRLIVPRGRLCRDRAAAREAEPRLGTVGAELGATQFDDFECRLDGERDLSCRAARWTHLARRAFGRANEAEPQASGCERCRNPRGEKRALLGFIEDMKAAAVKNELEGAFGWGNSKEVQGCETATEMPTIQLRVGSFDRERCDVDATDLEAALREPNRIRARPRADLERPRGPNPAR
jgi:hypothetical protein